MGKKQEHGETYLQSSAIDTACSSFTSLIFRRMASEAVVAPD